MLPSNPPAASRLEVTVNAFALQWQPMLLPAPRLEPLLSESSPVPTTKLNMFHAGGEPRLSARCNAHMAQPTRNADLPVQSRPVTTRTPISAKHCFACGLNFHQLPDHYLFPQGRTLFGGLRSRSLSSHYGLRSFLVFQQIKPISGPPKRRGR